MRALLVLLAGCSAAPAATVEVRAPGLDPRQVTASAGTVETTPFSARVRTRPGEAITVSHPEACPAAPVKAPGSVDLIAAFTIDAPHLPVGYDALFELTAHAGCPPADLGEISWRQASGPPLAEGSGSGRSFKGRTQTLTALRGSLPVPWGIVPISAATQGAVTIEAVWTAPGRAPITRVVRVMAAARATGVPSLAVGAPVILGGGGWHIEEGSPDGELSGSAGLTIFTPGRPGRWMLADGDGRKLGVRANRHDDTPLDCGRGECHAPATQAAAASPMTHVLHNGLEGRLGERYDARCAIACHAVGEPGLEDGGFTDVAARLGVIVPARAAWAQVPRPLRRLGSVGCTACHGPAAIPEEGARWSILRADVCAVCHDAPPDYTVVQRWRESKMAHAGDAPGTGEERCRTCHTTAGFLASAGVRPLGPPLPDGVPPDGVACAACHAPHGAHGAHRLLRDLPAPASLGDKLPPAAAAGEPCLTCHAPIDDEGTEGSAAALWLGRGGLRVDDGAPLTDPSPHAGVPCTGCHEGASHTFRTDRATCTPCHQTRPTPDAGIAARAADLWGRVGGTARHPAPRPGGLEGPRARAAWNVGLVLEDPAAAVHNAPYARALLDEAALGLR